MPNTFSKMYAQCVFAVKYRKSLLEPEWRKELFAVIGNLIKENDCDVLIVNGVEDHVHCHLRFYPKISISNVMRRAKAKSSKWINESGYLENRFEWQDGFGCFTYSEKEIERVFKCIENQEEHHKKFSFIEEYLMLLKAHNIEFDPRSIFNDPI